MEEGSPAASATYYCFDHRATMAAILDMRKYPPHCPRPSTNSPIHPRADSTLRPAVAAAPPFPAFHVPPSRSYPPACLPACRFATPTSLESQGRRFPRAKGMLPSSLFSGPRFQDFLICVYIAVAQHYCFPSFFAEVEIVSEMY